MIQSEINLILISIINNRRSYIRQYSLLVNAISYYQLMLLVILLPLLLVIAIDLMRPLLSIGEITISIALSVSNALRLVSALSH